MMATVPHVTSGLGLRKFQADGFLLTRLYNNRYVMCFLFDCLLSQTGQQTVNRKAQHVPIVLYIYTVYLLMMDYKYTRNM